jgi:hypothetical protein
MPEPPALSKVGWRLVESRPTIVTAKTYSLVAGYYEMTSDFSDLTKKQLDLLTVSSPDHVLVEIVTKNLVTLASQISENSDSVHAQVSKSWIGALHR